MTELADCVQKSYQAFWENMGPGSNDARNFLTKAAAYATVFCDAAPHSPGRAD